MANTHVGHTSGTNSPLVQITRPGISSARLTEAGIRYVNADEAARIMGYQADGILIPYFHLNGQPLMVNGRHFNRLRLSAPTTSSAKYLSPRESGSQLYIPPGLEGLLGIGKLLGITEGECKALSLTESGYPCVGVGGITSACPGGELLPALSTLIAQARPAKLTFIGDNDTALIYDFAREAVKLATLAGVPVVLPRIAIDAPGKGPDDLRQIWGAEFVVRWQGILAAAEVVPVSTKPQSLAVHLLRREIEALTRLDGDAREKAREKIIKLAAAMSTDALAISEIQKIAVGALGIDKMAFRSAVKTHQETSRREAAERSSTEALAALAADGPTPIFFDGSVYWRREANNSFGKLCREDVRLHLNQAGLSKKGDPSPCDTALNILQINNRVDYAGSLCGRPDGLHRENGMNVLVTRGVSLPSAVRGGCSAVFGFIADLLGRAAGDQFADHQLKLFLLWLKFARIAIRAPNKHLPGHVLALVGPPGCGKSFLQSAIITPSLGGRCADPGLFFTGQTHFNADLWGGEHLVLGDKALDVNGAQRATLRNELKRAVAEGTYPLHGKGRDNLTFRPIWRISLSANDDPESAGNLPALDASFADKIIYMKCYAPPKPFFDAKDSGAREAFAAKIQDELPALLAVVDDYQTPPDLVKDRFGIIEWHHPYVLELIGEGDPLRPLADVLSQWIESWPSGEQVRPLSTVKLYDALNSAYQGNLSRHRISAGPTHLGHQLAKLCSNDSWRTRLRRVSWRTGGREVNSLLRGWEIFR